MSSETGDKYCLACGKWLGNYKTLITPEGKASYFSIIKRKWCDECRPVKRTQDVRFNMVEYRKRRRKQVKEQEQHIQKLTEQVNSEKINIVNVNGNNFPIAEQKDICYLNAAIDYLYRSKYNKEIINSLESISTLLELQNNLYSKGA